MFEVGWSEMLVIAVVMIVVVGPKDLPKMLRTMGRMTAKLRGMAGDFQRQFNEALKEAELDDVKKSVDSLRSLNPMAEIRKQFNPFEDAAADVRAGLDQVMKPKPAEPTVSDATETAQPAEPLKNGAAALPDGLDAPAAQPQAAPATPAQAPAAPAAAVAPEPAKKGKAASDKAASSGQAPAAARKARATAAKSAAVTSTGKRAAPAARKESAGKVAEKAGKAGKAGKREAKGTPK